MHSQATLFAGRFLGGPHRLKMGLEIENERYFRELDRGPDLHYYIRQNPLGAPIGVATARVSTPRATEAEEFYSLLAEGLPRFTIVPQVFTANEGIGSLQQDLALALGVGPNQVPIGATAVQSATWHNPRRAGDVEIRNLNFSPRFSLAWDPWSDGKTKFSVSVGRYYDKIFLAVPLLELEPATTSLSFLAQEFLDNWVAYEPYGGGNATVSMQTVDRELRTPYQDELMFSFERQLWPETSVKLSYIKRDYQDQLQDIDVNHRFGDEGVCVGTPVLGDTTVKPSPGTGATLADPYTGNIYEDTDPGPGDGRIDDCIGDIVRINGVYGWDIERPDGKPDLYVLNPGWGELLLVGNFNTTEYEAFVVELVRRQFRNWQMNASYTLSEATGDAEDFTEIQGNERNLLEDERGPLAFDQRHMVKVSAVTITPWNFRLGGTLRWESGLPYSVLTSRLTAFNVPLDYEGVGTRDLRSRLRYPTGQRNDQRNPSYWTVDARFAKEFDLNRRTQLQVTAEVFNLFDDQTLALESNTNGTATGVRRLGRSYQLGLRLAF